MTALQQVDYIYQVKNTMVIGSVYAAAFACQSARLQMPAEVTAYYLALATRYGVLGVAMAVVIKESWRRVAEKIFDKHNI